MNVTSIITIIFNTTFVPNRAVEGGAHRHAVRCYDVVLQKSPALGAFFGLNSSDLFFNHHHLQAARPTFLGFDTIRTRRGKPTVIKRFHVTSLSYSELYQLLKRAVLPTLLRIMMSCCCMNQQMRCY